MSELFFTKRHEWVKVDGEQATIGISDYAQEQLGDIVFVELPEVDEEIEQGDEFGVVESVKAASDLYMPISGKIVEINEELEDAPELVNEDAMGNWMIKVEVSNKEELEDLLSEDQYKDFLEEE
ncbi:glycine cleavage system protein GcvH [Isachenkonia alkalipeptolytica]|uniref:Glycine cleavage system H protein n=1 Tax=Isachenkonia alkalipeptolytica TaxID=2565777 RepID=A0AA43XJM4_9CLOT|nr:glycine cleavage system protein GcvH [Isachenkonia alkalipeptolytica]NBG88038.1 glycine cleavage system protein GcvH [Isachenkonia alkalipeptolytica]